MVTRAVMEADSSYFTDTSPPLNRLLSHAPSLFKFFDAQAGNLQVMNMRTRRNSVFLAVFRSLNLFVRVATLLTPADALVALCGEKWSLADLARRGNEGGAVLGASGHGRYLNS